MIKSIPGAGVKNVLFVSRPYEFTPDFICAAREIEETGASEVSCFLIGSMTEKAELRRAILDNSATRDKKKLGSVVLETANQQVSADAQLSVFLLECNNLPTYSQLLRKTFGIYIYVL